MTDTIAVIVGEMREWVAAPEMMQQLAEWADRLAALGDLNEFMQGQRRDARRYRHLRKDGVIWRVNMLALAKDDIDILFGEKADAAIDAAMKTGGSAP